MVDLQGYLADLRNAADTADRPRERLYESLGDLFRDYAERNGGDDARVTTLGETGGGTPSLRVRTGADGAAGYVEATRPGSGGLDAVAETERLTRRRSTFENVVLTDFAAFRLYRGGELVASAELADPSAMPADGPIPDPTDADAFEDLLGEFLSHSGASVDSAESLAAELAKRTRFLRTAVRDELDAQADAGEGDVYGLYRSFRRHLAPESGRDEFADVFGQTVAYGLLVARTRVSGMLTRARATNAIPSTGGVLDDVFEFVSAGDPPAEIAWIVEDVCALLSNADVDGVLRDGYGERGASNPLIQFYETFLEAYDPETRRGSGAYYTPEPVVAFVAESVHALLKSELGRREGLADESVAVLDPAAGAMGFLAGATDVALREAAETRGSDGRTALLSEHVLRNYHAFERHAGAYAVGRLQMSTLLAESGYELSEGERVNLYRTDTLEPERRDGATRPVASSLGGAAEGVRDANAETSALAILGNPPYSGHSENRGEWIESLVDDYKDGYPDLGKRGQAKWLRDDYVKFVRWAQWRLSDASEGVLAYVTNHAYLDNPTFRGMREQLLLAFDEIYVLDLHGNANRGEEPPDGGTDENVFDIRQGVAVSIYVANADGGDDGDEEYADVYHADLWGTRSDKYEFLRDADLTDVSWEAVAPREPFYLFVPRDRELAEAYRDWPSVPDVFSTYGDPAPGIVTTHNEFAISRTPDRQREKVRRLLDTDDEDEARERFDLCSQDQWRYEDATAHLRAADWEDRVVEIQTGPFDRRYTVYDEHVAVHRRAERLSRHMLAGENVSLSVPRRTERTPFDHAFVADGLMTHHGVSTKEVNYQFPLYLYPDAPEETCGALGTGERETNVDERLLARLARTYSAPVSAEDVFYYVYAVLYTPTYRLKYTQFMESDFPRIPFPADDARFDEFAGYGERLAELHLLRHPCLDSPGVRFEGGNGAVVSARTGEYGRRYDAESERFYPNGDDYFAPVPADVWEYEIGGRQALKKWMQGRIGAELTPSETRRFCRMVRAVRETVAIQTELDDAFGAIESNAVSFGSSDR